MEPVLILKLLHLKIMNVKKVPKKQMKKLKDRE
jgi:hypothetical protein